MTPETAFDDNINQDALTLKISLIRLSVSHEPFSLFHHGVLI